MGAKASKRKKSEVRLINVRTFNQSTRGRTDPKKKHQQRLENLEQKNQNNGIATKKPRDEKQPIKKEWTDVYKGPTSLKEKEFSITATDKNITSIENLQEINAISIVDSDENIQISSRSSISSYSSETSSNDVKTVQVAMDNNVANDNTPTDVETNNNKINDPDINEEEQNFARAYSQLIIQSAIGKLQKMMSEENKEAISAIDDVINIIEKEETRINKKQNNNNIKKHSENISSKDDQVNCITSSINNENKNPSKCDHINLVSIGGYSEKLSLTICEEVFTTLRQT